jgi:hypothetical protein
VHLTSSQLASCNSEYWYFWINAVHSTSSIYIWEKRDYPSKEGHIFMLSLVIAQHSRALPASKCGKASTERRKDTREGKEEAAKR